MNLNIQQISNIIENQSDPEPFSGVVYLTKGDEVLFASEQGYAIKSESIPNKINTRFQVASGCKIFTSAAICQLAENGNLSFDTLLKDCTDVKFPNFAEDITIHHLLTHSSGITSYFEEDVNSDYETLWRNLPMYKVKEPRDFLPLFQNKSMKFSPGEKFDYNDGGFILLGLIIESVTGIGFADYIRKNVFEPAGMTDSGYFLTDQLPERTAYAYIKNDDGSCRTNFFAVPIIGAPDGGAYTTAPDMLKFWKALTDCKILNVESTELMLKAKISTGEKSPYSHYGYGVWIDQQDGIMNKFFVVGSDPGVALKSVVYIKEDIILTVIGNTGDALWPMYKEIEKRLEL